MGSIYMGSAGAGNPIRRPSIRDLTIGRFQWRETDRAAGQTPSVPEAAFVCLFPEEDTTSTVEGFSDTHLTDENAKFVSIRRFAFDASDCSAVESDVMTVHLGALIGRPGRLTWARVGRNGHCAHVASVVWRTANRRTYFGGRLQQWWCVLKPQTWCAGSDWLVEKLEKCRSSLMVGGLRKRFFHFTN